ncbi:Spo76 protein [Verticillium alfalfae VaMs.102]|uniref:Spo76 protein n=1 Tax=Verticillium alfalfae (strain VaMs.102 / ATCC MYA-4576 / FGSC 10136) TaxID=526221 RepID=C9SPC9_VERA1|nr:Spo76 protein [Verticillium alfalfae VaMs.102]EEY20644.1 Spo76 protein [Verticillium alfalfae VaMs.102]
MARASRRRGRAEPEPEPEVVDEVEEVEEIQEETPEAGAEEDDEEEEAAAGTQDQAEQADPENDNEAAQSGEVFSLQFDEELTWRVGRPIAVSTLLKRLEKLSEELGTLEQDHVDLESLSHVCEALGQRNLLAHKDQGVRAYTASCIADILQLSAPNAPFTPDQLQMFFDLVIKDVFTHLGDQSHPYHKQHKYVLASLNDTQSILLINDVDGADNLLQRMFSSFFDTASSTTHDDGRKMVHYVSQYFSDVIIDASRFAAKSNGHRHGGDNEDDDTPRGPTDSEVRELRKAHLLIKELWRAAPSVLQNVIPQVEAELSADNVELRQIATETLGDMISGIGAAGPPPVPVLDPAAYPPLRLADEDPSQVSLSILTTPLSPQSFAQTHHTAYTSFIGRSRDKTPAIRAAWTTAVGYILSTSAGGIGLSREEQAELVRALAEKLGDGDEKVRLAAVKTIELFGFRDFVLKLGSGGGSDKETPIIRSLLDRCRDKRPAIRVEAMTLLAKLWGVGAGELAAGQELVTTALKSIPSTIFNAWYANHLELNVLIDRVIFECLLPLSYPPTKTKGSKNTASQSQSVTSVPSEQDSLRTERILLLVQSLDAQARKAFFTMQARQPQFGQVLEAFIKQCEAYNGGVMDAEGPKRTAALERTIQYIGQFFPDPLKVKSDYMRFAKAHDRRNYQLIRFAISSQSDYKTVRGAIKELVKRMQNSPKGQDLAAALDTLIPFLYRSACIIFNKSHLSAILESSKSNKESFGTIAHEILHEISARNPDMFKNFVGDLCEELVEQAPTEKKTNDPSTVDILRACSSFAKKYPKEIPDTQKFTRALQHYALYGRPVKASKYAIKIMLAKNDKQGQVTATAVFEKAMKQFEYGAPHFLNKLQVIAQLYLQAPKVVEEKDEEILDMAIQKIVRTTREEAVDDSSAPQWVEDANMSEELQAKLYSLRIAVNRIRSNEDQEEAKAQAVSVMKLLMTLVKKDGEISKTGNTPAHFRSRLRLLAGQLILKLCTLKHLDDTLNHKDFHTLAYLVQDAVLGVRKGFVEKLMKYLVLNRLRHRFYTIIFLTAYEPEPELKQHIETWIRSRVQSMAGNPQNPMEAILARLIPLLAHHPDYSTDPENLVDHAQYLIYYISHVATEKNLGLIYKYAERVKQTRDNLDPEKSENLYVVSDLASAPEAADDEKEATPPPGKVQLGARPRRCQDGGAAKTAGDQKGGGPCRQAD